MRDHLLGFPPVLLALGDERPRDARAEEILSLVNRPGVNHRIDEVAREFLNQIEAPR